MTLQEIGDFVKAKRKEFKLSQGDLAKLSETSRSSVSHIERGKNVEFETLQDILSIFGKTLEITDIQKNSA